MGGGRFTQPRQRRGQKSFQNLLVEMLKENNIEFIHVEESDYDSRFLRCVDLVKEMMGEQR
ncbi:Trifunctional NAD biosynthesis/regulator protein NadR [Cedecea neteri]|uniref:Trifunctional NAD biosynthesis/regulator protein NadR n=1 Tax=Cedecea neteri TaxID=158822 RepID=A0A2X2SZM6_9ENTR|nr:Trifunctional NAD biosynthesis/regulator protein NadR [Cedecea neteri]